MVVLSAVLLILCFPPFNCAWLAWGALVPMLLVLRHQRPGRAFLLGYWAGLIFFLGTLYWFIHVTLPGMLLLNAFLALYVGLFAVAVRFFSQGRIAQRIWIVPCCGVAVEFIRAHLFSGFGWVSLGHSQYQTLPIIQIAELTGVYGVSFLICLANMVLAEFFFPMVDTTLPRRHFQPRAALLPPRDPCGRIHRRLAARAVPCERKHQCEHEQPGRSAHLRSRTRW